MNVLTKKTILWLKAQAHCKCSNSRDSQMQVDQSLVATEIIIT